MKRRALLGLALCAAVVAASYPILLGLEAYPRAVFYGPGVFAISAAGTPDAVNDSLAASLAAQPWADLVSPEAYAFSAWGGTPVVVRGVDPNPFLAMEDGLLRAGTVGGAAFVLVGQGFAMRTELFVGSAGVLTGSTASAFEPVTVTGVYLAEGPANDEVLVPLPLARKFAGLAADGLSAIRVRTANLESLKAFLTATGAPLGISGDAGTAFVNAPERGGERLTSLLFLYPELRRELGRTYVAAFAQQGVNGVRVVILAYVAMLTLLAVAGTYAVVWRATKEAWRPLGVLRVVGARPRTVLAALMEEFVARGAVAILIGVVAGFFVALAVGASGALLVFAHALNPPLDLSMAGIAFAVPFAAAVVSTVIAGALAIRRTPRDLIAQVDTKREPAHEEALPL